MNAYDMYSSSQQGNVNKMVAEHAELVKKIAFHLMNRLPSTVQVEDLIQSGMIGLIEATHQYDASHGASFDTYAGIRIRGAMLDEIRKSDWTPRSVHRNTREVTKVIRDIEQQTGCDAKDTDVAKTLGISLSDYHSRLRDTSRTKIFSFDQQESDTVGILDKAKTKQATPLENLENTSFQAAFAAEIKKLPEREKYVMSFYYQDELNFKEIGEVLGVSESRISQIHGQAIVRLKSRLSSWKK
jgi:RNA polymerase sigma factor for flagellar operon FliA